MSVDSSLIFLVVIGLWMTYLVPTWLRRREQLSASRARDRSSAAMRVLAPRPEPTDRSHRPVGPAYVLTPPAPAREPGSPAEASSPADVGGPPRLPRAGLVVMGVLLLSVLAVPGTMALAALTLAPGWSPAAPGGLVVLVLGALRLRARRRIRPAREGANGRGLLEPSSVVLGDIEHENEVPGDGGRPDRADPQRELLPGEWTPVPVPLPSYLLKEEVPRRRTSTLELDEVSRWHADWRERPATVVEPAVPEVDEDDIPTYAPPVRRALGA